MISWQEIVLALIAIVPAVWSLAKQYKKDKADVRSTDADTIAKYIKMVDDLTTDVSELRNENVDFKNLISTKESEIVKITAEKNTREAYLISGITLLTSQLIVNRITPVWKLEERESVQ